MVDKMTDLHDNGTWGMVPLLYGKSIISCRSVFMVKYLSDGTIERYKVRLVSKRYKQTYGIYYVKTY